MFILPDFLFRTALSYLSNGRPETVKGVASYLFLIKRRDKCLEN